MFDGDWMFGIPKTVREGKKNVRKKRKIKEGKNGKKKKLCEFFSYPRAMNKKWRKSRWKKKNREEERKEEGKEHEERKITG